MKAATLIHAGRLDYQTAWDYQKRLHRRRVQHDVPDTLILTEHPHTYTIGKSGDEANLVTDERLLNHRGIKVHRIDRGGDITYHGPGQIVGYPILDLHDHYLDTLRFLRDLEKVIILTLAEYQVQAERVPGLTGVWVDGAKIAAIGVKISRWVTMHGFAFNVNTDLGFFTHIVPCGIGDKSVTSLRKLLGREVDMAVAIERVVRQFECVFGIHFNQQFDNLEEDHEYRASA